MALRVGWRGPAGIEPLAPMVALSLAAHLAAAAVGLFGARLLPRRPPQAPVIVVDLVSLPPGGAGPLEAPRATPPPPAPKKEEAPAPAGREKPPPKAKKPEAVKLPDPAKPAAKPRAEAQPAPAPEPAPGRGVTPPGASPEPGPAPGVGGQWPPGFGEQKQGSIGALDDESFEFAWYRAALTQRLRTVWVKPEVQELTAPLRATVYFKVTRSGRITDIQLEAGSGLDLLDRSALRAVYDANPLPPLPYAYKEDMLGVHFFFELVPE